MACRLMSYQDATSNLQAIFGLIDARLGILNCYLAGVDGLGIGAVVPLAANDAICSSV